MRLLYKTGPMESLRKWFYKPKRDDRSLLAQFFFADEALNMIASELDSFDGRKDPDRCSTLVNQLRHAQDRVLNITSQIMDQVLGEERVARGFRVKFPEDVLQDNLAGQLWFGAECLAAGSSIMNREEESAAMRPLAKALTRSLETVRSLLREECLRGRMLPLDMHHDLLRESLRIFDRLFAEFELCYVSAMVNVKTPHEFEAQQLICVLFSETLRRALKQSLLTQEQVDAYDPALMFAVPRLAIVNGLLIYASGPLSLDKSPDEMSDMFRPFRTLLHKIRSLLWTLDRRELMTLERLLCTNEDISKLTSLDLPHSTGDNSDAYDYPDIGEFVTKFYSDHAHCTDFFTQQSSGEPTITEHDYLPDNIEVVTPIIEGLQRLSQQIDYNELSTQNSVDSTDTFQSNDSKDFLDARVRKTSRGTDENRSEISSLRNLSTNGLLMFDPLVAVTASTSSENRQMPDNDLVTSLNEQVTEIADRLSNIQANNMTDQLHSFSTNDVPTLIATDDSGDYGIRNDLNCVPSTSHGYLIPNAISQEPVVLASLSHNNSAIFNQDDEANDGAMNTDLPLIMSDSIDAEIVNTNICITNANLSSLLLTNEEYRNSFDNVNNDFDGDNASFHSAKTHLDKNDDKVKFMLGYESEHESPADSGVSTENTSLDRSPDSDPTKDRANHFMQQNRVLKSPDCERIDSKSDNSLESSFSNANNGDVTVNIVYIEQDTQKNEAGSSHEENIMTDDQPTGVGITLQDCETNVSNEQDSKTDNQSIPERMDSINDDNNRIEPCNSTSNTRRKSRKSASKSKKKGWTPGIVLLDNRTPQTQNTLELNLDHLVDSASSDSCAKDEKIALALQRASLACEMASRKRARRNFKSSEDLIHRLFVCIAGVADQLQTNFAADLRNILKAVFLMNQTPEIEEVSEKKGSLEFQATEDQVIQNGSSIDSVYSAEEVYADSNSDCTNSESSRANNDAVADNQHNNDNNQHNNNVEQREHTTQRRKSMDNGGGLQASVSTGDLTYSRDRSESGQVLERLPEWVPDIAAAACMRCRAAFTAFRRRHHCRNCGKVFCASCSANSVPLPRYGQMKPVRVCEECFQTVADACRRRR